MWPHTWPGYKQFKGIQFGKPSAQSKLPWLQTMFFGKYRVHGVQNWFWLNLSGTSWPLRPPWTRSSWCGSAGMGFHQNKVKMKSFYTNQCCLTVLATKTDSVVNEKIDFIYCRYCKNGPGKKSKKILEFIFLKSTLLPKNPLMCTCLHVNFLMNLFLYSDMQQVA